MMMSLSAQTVKVVTAEGREERVEVPVWNGTVANLVSKVLGRVRLKLE